MEEIEEIVRTNQDGEDVYPLHLLEKYAPQFAYVATLLNGKKLFLEAAALTLNPSGISFIFIFMIFYNIFYNIFL